MPSSKNFVRCHRTYQSSKQCWVVPLSSSSSNACLPTMRCKWFSAAAAYKHAGRGQSVGGPPQRWLHGSGVSRCHRNRCAPGGLTFYRQGCASQQRDGASKRLAELCCRPMLLRTLAPVSLSVLEMCLVPRVQ